MHKNITGERLYFLRKKKKLSAAALGAMIGKDKASIYRYEKGLVAEIPAHAIKGLADALGTTPEYLLGLTNENTPSNSLSSSVGKMVEYYRVRLGISNQELADRVGIPVEDELSVEQGKNQIFQRELMMRFAAALGVEAAHIINERAIVESIGLNMRSVRELSLVDFDSFCASSGFDPARYAEIESGSDPSFDEINLFIDYFKIPAQWVINFDFGPVVSDNRLKVAFHLMSSAESISDAELDQILAFIDFILSRRA